MASTVKGVEKIRQTIRLKQCHNIFIPRAPTNKRHRFKIPGFTIHTNRSTAQLSRNLGSSLWLTALRSVIFCFALTHLSLGV
ncbi:hypothetical protein VitviT2T_029893 [Vitis vinifera]|uniref:Uncharacterized protein n=1 Tax=Vitis vinifera TaxID=29760 RepID=A0ABY9DXP1_VITVI|nr:hypothetical protein VitviT2T_029893 [Vitis vinifera]